MAVVSAISDTSRDEAAFTPNAFPWHFNFGRTRVLDGKTERTAFSPTDKNDSNVPEKFAKLWGR